MKSPLTLLFIFFFNDTATTEIYTLSLHDALPISWTAREFARRSQRYWMFDTGAGAGVLFMAVIVCLVGSVVTSQSLKADRKSTRLNSSHQIISYAVFCLKKKKKKQSTNRTHKV